MTGLYLRANLLSRALLGLGAIFARGALWFLRALRAGFHQGASAVGIRRGLVLTFFLSSFLLPFLLLVFFFLLLPLFLG